jgi:hypothetical protein
MTDAGDSKQIQNVPPTNTMATVSLISGIVGLTFIPVAGSIVAIVTGHIARHEIRDAAGAEGGKGLATAGLVLGWVGVGLGVVGICLLGLFLAVPLCLAVPIVESEIGAILPALVLL